MRLFTKVGLTCDNVRADKAVNLERASQKIIEVAQNGVKVVTLPVCMGSTEGPTAGKNC